MKPIVIVLVVAVVGGIAVIAMNKRLHKETVEIRTAFGNAGPDTIQMNAVMNTFLTMGASTGDPRKAVVWHEWMPKHFEIRDASGRTVPLELRGQTNLITEPKQGLHEGIIFATLKPGATYTMDYITPELQEPKRTYRRTFTAPSDTKEMQRMIFEAVEEK